MLVRNVSTSPEVVDETAFRRSHKRVSFPPGELSADLLAEYDAAPLRLLPPPDLGPKQRAKRKAAPEFVGGEWVHGWDIEDVPVTADDVKAEAYRRIVAVVPEYRQRNLIARATELLRKGVDNWTADEQAEWDAGQAIWDQVKAIRAASDAIEAMDRIPQDYAADKHWP